MLSPGNAPDPSDGAAMPFEMCSPVVFSGRCDPDFPGMVSFDCFGFAAFSKLSRASIEKNGEALPIFGHSVYVLEGWGASGRPRWYIGEGQDPIQRLISHSKTRDWWRWAFMIHSTTGRMLTHHAKCLETRLIHIAMELSIELDNRTLHQLPRLNETDKVILDRLTQDAIGFLHCFSAFELLEATEENTQKVESLSYEKETRRRRRVLQGKSSPCDGDNNDGGPGATDREEHGKQPENPRPIGKYIVELLAEAESKRLHVPLHGRNGIYQCRRLHEGLRKVTRASIEEAASELLARGIIERKMISRFKYTLIPKKAS